MAKKTAPKTQDGENPRRPCPCGSGKRWKACHGAGDDVIVTRPFAGLAAECDLVALREFLPSATAPLPLVEPLDVPVTVASVLPGACAALVRPDGEIWLGMQVQTRSGDLSVDLARALALGADGRARDVAAGGAGPGAESGRLQDVLDPDAALDVTVHRDFAWWLVPEDGDPSAEVAATLERANKVVIAHRAGRRAAAAYWVDTGSKAHLRWVRPEPEDALVAAMARLHARGELDARRRQPLRGLLPGARPARAGVGPRPRAARQGVGRAGRAVRRPSRRGARRPGAAHRRRAPGPRRAGGQAGHLALSAM